MKSSTIVSALTLLFLVPGTLAFIVIPDLNNDRTPPALTQDQGPIMNLPNIALPPFKHDEEHPKDTGEAVISDIIGIERSINIFAGFTRDIEEISNRLDHSGANTTVLAPLNSQIQKLPRKPWEDPKDYEALGQQAYDGISGEERAHKNLRRFVEAHIVPTSPWKEGEKVTSLGGDEVWWEEKDGKKIVCSL